MQLRERLAQLSDSIESRLWPIPAVSVVVSVIIAFLMPRFDVWFDASLPNSIDTLIFNGGADTARSVLSSIAGSLITATSLTFSLTVVALQLASSQASPRVMRLFARDRQVHLTLAVFLGTFAYSITALRSVRSADGDLPEFVPRLTVTLGFLLTLLSVVMLVFFLAHLATQLRVETIMREIHSDTDETIQLISDSNASQVACASPVVRAARPAVILTPSSGFITNLDRSGLVRAATDRGIVIEELRHVGDGVTAGTPLAHWWVSTGEGSVEPEDVEAAVQRCIGIGYERTASQDVEYGLQQLVDIALRALSPGINDPTTASTALGHLGSLLSRLFDMPVLPEGIADADGHLRVVTAPSPRAKQVHLALSQIRHYGATDPQVAQRFLQVLADLAYTSQAPDIRAALRDQLDALEQQLRRIDTDPTSLAMVLSACSRLHPTLL